jgi:hypothetical protein
LTIINQDDRISIGYHKIRLTDLLDDNESKSVDWKDLLIPGRFIEKSSISTLIIVILACYPIIVGFGVPTILTLYNVTVRRTNLKIELDVWGLSPYGYWIFRYRGHIHFGDHNNELYKWIKKYSWQQWRASIGVSSQVFKRGPSLVATGD